MIYIGAWLDPVLMQKVTERLLSDAGTVPLIPGLTPDIEICERSGDGRKVWIVINHGGSPQTVRLPMPVKSALVGNLNGGSLQLAAHDVGVVEMSP